MNRENIIKLAAQVYGECDWHDSALLHLERFAALVAAAAIKESPDYKMGYADGVAVEREKSLRLWMLLDDVDTADDIAKADDDIYRSLCRQAHAKRWDVLTGDEVDIAIRARGQA
jgi:hypothetical protein